MPDLDTITVMTPNCLRCKRSSFVAVSRAGYERWQGGAFVQDAFPELDRDQRELLITGTHPECWAALFPEED